MSSDDKFDRLVAETKKAQDEFTNQFRSFFMDNGLLTEQELDDAGIPKGAQKEKDG